MRALPARCGTTWIAAAGAIAIIAAVAGCAPPATNRPATNRPATNGPAGANRPAGPLTLADATTASLTLAYACRFPAGTYQAGAHVTASYRATAEVGRAMRPASLTLSVTVPAAALSSLGPPGAAIAVTARLATSGVAANNTANNTANTAANTATGTTTNTVASTQAAASPVWASLAAAPAQLPATGQGLRSGPMLPAAPLPALKAAHAGRMTVTVGSLKLQFTPQATRTPGAGGAVSAAVAAACTLEPGQHTALATITVRQATADPSAKVKKPHRPCPPLPRGGLKLNPRFPLPKRPRGVTVTHPGAQLGCAYIAGYADVRKLDGAALVGPGLTNLSIGDRVVFNLNSGYFEEDSAAQLDFRPCHTCRIVHALPPARATFLAFGFMPVSATLQLIEVGTINIIGVGTVSTLKTNTAWSLLALRISDVKVNGQPLAVGAHCQTVRPVLVKLTGFGTGPQPYSLQGGGPLTGKVTIPPFTGCGVTENLDPLFTGTVSGPGNFAKLTQGSLCTLIGNLGCPPPVPKPRR